jgi:hypothetical protein
MHAAYQLPTNYQRNPPVAPLLEDPIAAVPAGKVTNTSEIAFTKTLNLKASDIYLRLPDPVRLGKLPVGTKINSGYCDPGKGSGLLAAAKVQVRRAPKRW